MLALVLGQVVPAVKDARRESLLAGCQDRMGRIAAAGLIYASEDAGELAIPIGPGDANSNQPYSAMYGFGGKSGLGPSLSALSSPFSGLFRMAAMDRPLNTILFKESFERPRMVVGGRGGPYVDWNRDARLDLDTYHCPADNGFPGMHYSGWKASGLSGYDYFGTSYAAASLLIGYPYGSFAESNSVYYRPVSRVPNPESSIVYWEAAARFAMFATNHDLDQSGCFWPYSLADFTAFGWHGTPYSFVTARADGHVAWTQMKGYGLSAPLAVLPPDYSEASARCIMVRAPGWQLDTLPGQPVTTNKFLLGAAGVISTSDGDGAMWNVVAQ